MEDSQRPGFGAGVGLPESAMKRAKGAKADGSDWPRGEQLTVISWPRSAASREPDMEPFVDADKSVIVSHFHRPTSY